MGACAVASLIFCGRCGKDKEFMRRFTQERYGYGLTLTTEAIRPTYRHTESCQTSVPQAIIAFLESDSFESAIRQVVSLGGDADTQAAIAAVALPRPTTTLATVLFQILSVRTPGKMKPGSVFPPH